MPQPAALQRRSYGVETTFGTAVTPNRWAGIVVSSSEDSERNFVQTRAGGSLEPDVNAGVEYNFKGSVDTILQEGGWMRFGWNSLATSGSPTVTHNLNWVDASGALPSFTFEIANTGSPNVNRRFAGCKFTRLSLTNDQRNVLHMEGDWLASTVATAAGSAGVAALTVLPYLYSNGTVSVGGSTIAEVTNVTLNVNTALEEQHYVQSGTAPILRALDETQRSYDGNVQIKFLNNDWYARFLGNVSATAPAQTGSMFNMSVTWQKAANDSIQVVLSGCNFSSAQPEGGDEGLLHQTLNYIAQNADAVVTNVGSPLGLLW